MVMEQHGVKWLQKGTHEKHLSVLDFEKQERAKEVAELDSQKQEKTSEVAKLNQAVSSMKQELMTTTIKQVRAEEAVEKARVEGIAVQRDNETLSASNQQLRVENTKQIFATQRGYGELKGGWEFPGGKIEAGETPQDALVREINEELDARINVGELLDTIEYDYPAFHLSMDCFLCELAADHLELKEHEDAKWLTIEELDSVDWLPADVTLVDKIKGKQM